MRIIWMDGELERLALRMMAPDELKKEPERLVFHILVPGSGDR